MYVIEKSVKGTQWGTECSEFWISTCKKKKLDSFLTWHKNVQNMANNECNRIHGNQYRKKNSLTVNSPIFFYYTKYTKKLKTGLHYLSIWLSSEKWFIGWSHHWIKIRVNFLLSRCHTLLHICDTLQPIICKHIPIQPIIVLNSIRWNYTKINNIHLCI